MRSLLNIVVVVFCGLTLSHGAQAETNPSGEKRALSPGAKVITGKVLRLKGDHLYMKNENGKEVHMHIDQTTKMSDKKLEPGELVEATVNEENQVLSIHSPDRRSDHILESGPASQ